MRVRERLGRARALVSGLRGWRPADFYRRHQRQQRRRTAEEEVLVPFSRRTAERFDGRVLIDATWDNPNYWIRYALLRATLGLGAGHEVGFVGAYNGAVCTSTLKRFGVRDVIDATTLRPNHDRNRRDAQALLRRTRTADDVLDWRLPHDWPADFVYDGILKRQRAAWVDVGDPRVVDYVLEALDSIDAAEALLERHRPDLVVLSHGINFQLASLAWLAARRRIPVVILYGDHGVARFAKVRVPGDLYQTMDRPTAQDIETLPKSRATALAGLGTAYLRNRRQGRTSDLGATLAFQKPETAIDRDAVCARFGWDPCRRIIAVYASNWFDFPRSFLEMVNFRDFADWIEATLQRASQNDSVNWLFKAHPVDARYGGVTLAEQMPKRYPRHIALAPGDWNGSDLMEVVDGVVTCRGTAGIEYAAMGKPVLLADRGWYHDVGFAKWAKSREDYLQALADGWWTDFEPADAMQRARIFAGWYYGRPAWQGGFVLDDDSVQWPIYDRIPALFAANEGAIATEVETIGRWLHSSYPHYHTYKMSLADAFAMEEPACSA